MNIEQAKRQAEMVYEASYSHLGEEAAQRMYDETLLNLMEEAEDADAVARVGARVAAMLAKRMAAAADADHWQRQATNFLQRQITDYDVWTEYVDPQGAITEEQFHKMNPIEKLVIIQIVFGADAENSADADAADTASAR